MSINFCGCCGNSVYELKNKSLIERIEGTDHEGMKDIIKCTTLSINDLDDSGKQLINWCVDFLLFQRLEMNFYKLDQSGYHKTKYIAIWSFIYDFLKIESGYDYWLMSFLEWNNLMDHGTGIRCGWYIGDECNQNYKSYVLSEEHKNIILNWANNADDNI